ncbi:hypothetical protein SK128_007368, partial [Halocaridina rubra]
MSDGGISLTQMTDRSLSLTHLTSQPGPSVPTGVEVSPFSVSRYDNASQLLNAQLRRHSGGGPFLCPHCDYTTVRSHDIKKHLRTHTGEKPYCCALCPYQTGDP